MEKSLRRLVLYYISGSEGAIEKIFLIQMVLTEKCFYYSASTPPTSSKMITSEFDFELYLLNIFNI